MPPGPPTPPGLSDPVVVIQLVAGQDELPLREPPAIFNFKTTSENQHRSKRLPILDAYLTFIHYFGFSINPNDDTSSRLLSSRVKRAANVASSIAKQRELGSSQEQCSSAAQSDVPGGLDAASAGRPVARAARPRWRLDGRLVKSSIKLTAISLTTFLTMNHVVVLADYIYQGSKALTELMLELRLVITKLSALIFVISWHRNQAEVRQLIRLITSTSVNILNSEQHNGCAARATDRARPSESDHPPGGGDSNNACRRLNEMDWRVLKWWICCTAITITHLSLSEAEIKSAQHLWEWLDDYSLHQLSNRTTSNATLFAMATFDNYMYTVHVYGTRLIGSSIICIVCTFQIENITCLTRQTLNLLRAYAQPASSSSSSSSSSASSSPLSSAASSQFHNSGHGAPSRWPSAWTGCDCLTASGDEATTSAAERRHHRHGGNSGDLFCRALFFVLGESDWNGVEQNRQRQAPIGRLSSPLARLWRAASLRQLNTIKRRLCGIARRGPVKCRELNRWFARTSLRVTLNRVTPFRWLEVTGAEAGSKVDRCNQGTRENGDDDDGGDDDYDELYGNSGCSRGRQASAAAAGSCSGAHLSGDGEPTPSRLHESNRCASHAPARQAELTPVPILRNYLDDYLARERAKGRRADCRLLQINASRRHNANLDAGNARAGAPSAAAGAGGQLRSRLQSGQEIELHLENLGRKYELIRKVNLRIDNCFGHMLLSQYSFLFLMSCIDVVFFSLSFNPNTKTKYIIVSGMILLWLPFLLLYKYASDVGLASKKLLTSVRRLARLAFILQLSGSGKRFAPEPFNQPAAATAAAAADLRPPPASLRVVGGESLFQRRWSDFERLQNDRLERKQRKHQRRRHHQQHHCATYLSHQPNPIIVAPSSRARIFNKLDHVFEPSHLSIVGLMTMNKFFLLNFAKIVITASVMTIQFISKN